MLRLAEKAFWPGRIPFAVDARRHRPQLRRGPQVPRPPRRRARREARRGLRAGEHRQGPRGGGEGPSRQPQPPADHDPARRHRRARVRRRVRRWSPRRGEGAGPRSASTPSATSSGSGTPRTSGPSCGSLYNGKHRKGEHIRAFPISNWTELDVWQYIQHESIEIPSIYYAHRREVFVRDGMWLAVSDFVTLMDDEEVVDMLVRYRTVGDASCTGAVESAAMTIEDVITEVAASRRHRARRHPRRRQVHGSGHGRPQEGRVLLMESAPVRHRRFGRRRQEHAHRPPALREQEHLRGPAEAVERTSRDKGFEYADLALLTDGLRAEREQGITIDVAYRYFSTPRRKFIIADTPGHTQYTRNMVTGASTADLALVLVDARQGLRRAEPAPRGDRVAAAGSSHLAVCVNKMDLVDWSQERFDEIRAEFTDFARKLEFTDLAFIPVTALLGNNVIQHSRPTPPWYQGPRCSGTWRTSTPARTAADRPPLPGPVRGRATLQRLPRLPALRRHGGRWGLPPRRRGPGLPSVWLDDRRRRPVRWPDRRRHARTCPSRSAWPMRSTSAGATCSIIRTTPRRWAGHRRHDLLVRRAAAAAVASTASAHHPRARAMVRGCSTTARRGHPPPPRSRREPGDERVGRVRSAPRCR